MKKKFFLFITIIIILLFFINLKSYYFDTNINKKNLSIVDFLSFIKKQYEIIFSKTTVKTKQKPFINIFITKNDYNYLFENNYKKNGFYKKISYSINKGSLITAKLSVKFDCNLYNGDMYIKSKKIKNNLENFYLIKPKSENIIESILAYNFANNLNLLTTNYKLINVYLNNKYLGLYFLLSDIDETFLREKKELPGNSYSLNFPLDKSFLLKNISKTAFKNTMNKNDYSDISEYLNNLLIKKNLEFWNNDKFINYLVFNTIFYPINEKQKYFYDNVFIEPSSASIYPVIFKLRTYSNISYKIKINDILNNFKIYNLLLKNKKINNKYLSKLKSILNNKKYLNTILNNIDKLNKTFKNNIYNDKNKIFYKKNRYDYLTNKEYDLAIIKLKNWINNRFIFLKQNILNYNISKNKKRNIKKIILNKNINLNKNLIINKNEILIVKPGTIINLNNNSSIISFGKVEFIGSKEKPIKINFNKKNRFNVIAINGKYTQNSIFKYVIFKNGSDCFYKNVYYSGMLSIHNSKVLIDHCKFYNNKISDDMLHIVKSNISITNNDFFNSNMDSIDLDYCSGELKNNKINSSGNDSIDLMGCDVLIFKNEFINSQDKGVSAGENTTAKIKKNYFKKCNTGIAVKDNSHLNISTNIFFNSPIAIALYKKNKRYSNGGYASINKNLFFKNSINIQKDKFSKINKKNNYFKIKKNILELFKDVPNKKNLAN